MLLFDIKVCVHNFYSPLLHVPVYHYLPMYVPTYVPAYLRTYAHMYVFTCVCMYIPTYVILPVY